MDDRNLKIDATAAAARHPRSRRRYKHGVVAGYIHEISARHQHVAPVAARRPRVALAPSRA